MKYQLNLKVKPTDHLTKFTTPAVLFSIKSNKDEVSGVLYSTDLIKAIQTNNHDPKQLSAQFENRILLDNTTGVHVPNVVHFVLFKNRNFKFTFARYITLISVEKFIKPALIVIWGDYIPAEGENEWWKRALTEVKNVVHVWHVHEVEEPAEVIAKQRETFIRHKVDWWKLQVLKEYGGIYMDHDMIVVRPLSELMKQPLVMGLESADTIAGGLIISKPRNLFIQEWINLCDQYCQRRYEANFASVGQVLAITSKDVYLLPGNFTDPYPARFNKYILFCGHYNFTYNYAVHIYRENMYSVPRNEKELAGFNCTLGDVMRKVLYGDTKLLSLDAHSGCVA